MTVLELLSATAWTWVIPAYLLFHMHRHLALLLA